MPVSASDDRGQTANSIRLPLRSCLPPLPRPGLRCPAGRLPIALYALTAGSFGIGCAEFVIMGLLLQVSADLGLHRRRRHAGLRLCLGVFAGAPVLTLLTRRMPRKAVLLSLMVIYTIGNAACALAPDYTTLMVARVLTSLTHGTFFGVGAVVATSTVPEARKASAISIMFSGLTLATLLGMPAGAPGPAFRLACHLLGHERDRTGLAAGDRPAGGAQPRCRARGAAARGTAHHGAPAGAAGLAMTVLQSMGIFAVITYVQPLLTRVTGYGEAPSRRSCCCSAPA